MPMTAADLHRLRQRRIPSGEDRALGTALEKTEGEMNIAVEKKSEPERLDWTSNFSESALHKVCYVCKEKFLGLHRLTR